MNGTIVVCGHGPGISDAVARRFGASGASVALVARDAQRLADAAQKLTGAGVKALAFPCDVADPAAVTRMIGDVRASLGPIATLHWNAYSGIAGDLLSASPAELRGNLDVSVTGLLAAVQAALPDLKSSKGAVLVTGGGFCFYDANVDSAAVQAKAMGLAVAKAAQHKLVGLLSKRLEREGIYVGEVVVLGLVKGTAFDQGNATLDPHAIAARFWELHGKRDETSVKFTG
jgi:NADP-dependent 3-hydroxy acid dehydrogenase YdfG